MSACNKLKVLNHSVFMNCPFLEIALLPPNIISIKSFCFTNDINLSSLVLPDSVEEINDFAFSDSGLTIINISANSNLTSLSQLSFQKLKLSSIFLPKTLKSLYINAFSECPLENIIIDKENPKYKSDSKSVYTGTDNSTLYKVAGAYSGEYTVASFVTSINEYCFYYCENLTSIQFHNKITTIGKYAFRYCKKLNNITIPDSLSKIESDAFGYCSSLSNISISENIKAIESYAFQHCYKLTQIKIPERVTKIGSMVFNSCYSLANITIPGNVSFIDDKAFTGCHNLKTIKFSNNINVIKIGTEQFWSIKNTMDVYIPGNFTIETSFENAFQNRSHLYITSDTILSEQCKNFFGEKRIYVHLDGNRIKDKATLSVIKYIAISFNYRISKQNNIHYSNRFSLLTIFSALNCKV